MKGTDWKGAEATTTVLNREENSLSHIAMVAKFLDENKRHLKSELALLQTSSILSNFI